MDEQTQEIALESETLSELVASSEVSLNESQFDSLLALGASIEITLVFLLAILIMLAGVVFGLVVTQKWHVGEK